MLPLLFVGHVTKVAVVSKMCCSTRIGIKHVNVPDVVLYWFEDV